MLKKYRLGFDVWGLVLFLVSMIPTFVWLAFPAPNDVLRTASSSPVADAIGMVLQVLFVATLCCVVRKEQRRCTAAPLAVSIVCMVLYFAGWLFYYLGYTTPAVILLLTVPPCLAFIFYAIARRNMVALIPAVGFTLCHLIYGFVNFIL